MPLTVSKPDALAYMYARSVFELAEAGGGREAIEQTLGELEDVLELARADAKLAEFLSSRVIAKNRRLASLDRIFGGRISDLTLKFLKVLNAKGRLGHLAAIIAALDATVQERFGRIEVDVYTADPISQAELASVRERLASALHKEVVVHPYTDGSMIGGVKFRIGDRLLDASVATRLRKMRDQLGARGSEALRSRFDNLIEPGA